MMLLRTFFIASVLALTACQKNFQLGPGNEELLASASEEACGFIQNAYGQRVSWKKALPVRMYIHQNFPTEFRSALTEAAQHWNDAAGMTLFLFQEDSRTPSQPYRDGISSIHWLSNWDIDKRNQQAVTNIYWSNNQVTEADISINAKDFNFYMDQHTTPFDVHLESLLVHELGHVLGLKHESKNASVMWAVLTGATVRSALTTSDRQTLKCEY